MPPRAGSPACLTVFCGGPTIRSPKCFGRCPAAGPRLRRPGALPRCHCDKARAAVFDGLKARLDRLLRESARSDPRAYVAGLREALLEARLGIRAMRDALGGTEHELAGERKLLE